MVGFLNNVESVRSFSDLLLIERLEKLVTLEKKTTAEILEVIKEVEARRLYLKMGFTSLFAYLTEGLGYAPASAQRRIESARLMRELPEIREGLAAGTLNLTQVSMLAQGFRQKDVSVQAKKEVLSKIKDQSVPSTQKILARELDLPVLQFEKVRVQQEGSTRLEITFSQEEMRIFQRVKELISHAKPNPSWAEVMVGLGEEFLKRRDPLRKKASREKSDSSSKKLEGFSQEPIFTSVPEAAPNQSSLKNSGEMTESHRPFSRAKISNPVRQRIFQRDHHCQWQDKLTGKVCGSKFQLQVDHRKPQWAGGGHEPANLQLLCSAHNRLKYRQEAGLRFS